MTAARGVTDEALTDEALTDILGPRCPACGWRRGRHRPGGLWLTACPVGAGG